MTRKTKRLLIITPIIFILIIALTLYFITRQSKSDEDKAPKPLDEITYDVKVENVSDGEEKENSIGKEIHLTLDENIKTDNNTGEKAEEPAKPQEPMKPEDAEKPLVQEKVYVQDADPETGVSWDGKSAIVYRLINGEETFDKQYGAYYEIRPDEWVLLEEPTEKEEWDGKCHHCGKVSGDGKNGTCIRWMMGDEVCPNCKTEVPVNTCHTCKEK